MWGQAERRLLSKGHVETISFHSHVCKIRIPLRSFQIKFNFSTLRCQNHWSSRFTLWRVHDLLYSKFPDVKLFFPQKIFNLRVPQRAEAMSSRVLRRAGLKMFLFLNFFCNTFCLNGSSQQFKSTNLLPVLVSKKEPKIENVLEQTCETHHPQLY